MLGLTGYTLGFATYLYMFLHKGSYTPDAVRCRAASQDTQSV